jgi:prolyl 4-hydroxylase
MSDGNSDLSFELANRKLFGQGEPRDLDAAHRLLRQAEGSGHLEAARLRAHLIASGTGCRANPDEAERLLERIAPRDPYARAQIEMLKRFSGAVKPSRDVVSASPEVVLVGGLLAPEECRYIMALAEPRLEPSVVQDPVTGRRIPHPVRTSYGASFGPAQEDLVINRVNRRLASVTCTRYEWGEPLLVLRYAPGQQYRPHVDTLPGAANQRFWTALIYLNDGYDGGGTDFPDLGITIGGAMGDALLFRNLTDEGRPEPRTRHAGLPVKSGEKWLATRWIRQAPYHPWSE